MSSSHAAAFERVIRAGGIALFPSDTVYGIACDPDNTAAIARLYTLKQRPLEKPSALMYFDRDLALEALPKQGQRTRDALLQLLPGPVTVLLAGGVGVRVVDVAELAGVGCAVLQSSANLSGGTDARRLADVPAEIRAGVDLEIDGGELPGLASTVLDLSRYEHDGSWRLIRRGAFPEQAIAAILGGARGTPRALVRSLTRAMNELPEDYFNAPIGEVDPEIAEALDLELRRQQRTLEMIASENFVPVAVLEAQGSVLTNKYAEGYPGKRYYGGCEYVDIAEQLAIDRAKALFGADHANVQPHSGAQANIAVYHALLQPGDKLMGLELAHGGHLTHGMKINASGRLYDIVTYGVDRGTSLIDMDEVERIAKERRPKMIVAGWSAYPRQLDFPRFREIADEVGAYLFVDMAHFAGLVAAGLHPSPVPYADVVGTTIHKTLGGPRSGMILCREEHAKAINSAVFPGQQGGPLEHVIAAKAVALKIAASEAFRERQRRTIAGAQAVAEALLAAGDGISVLTGGTDVHLVLCDLRGSELDGQQAEDRLDQVGITVNRNAVPFDPLPPMVTSGLRIGTPALATRGLQLEDFVEVGQILAAALQAGDFEGRSADLSARTAAIAERYPLYAGLRPHVAA